MIVKFYILKIIFKLSTWRYIMQSNIICCPTCNKLNRVPKNKLNEKPVCGVCKSPLFLSKPIDVNSIEFEKHIFKTDIPTLVDFWAPWCGPCKMMTPVLKQAASQFEPNIRILKVNTEENPQLSAKFGIQSIPTLILFKKGRQIARQSGAIPLPALNQWINSNL
jgi:thioredoxin 2